jgi:NDP-sugar pyrophosphorylase family protein
MNFSPEALFDLTSYQHAALFDGCESAWEALGALSLYLKQSSLGMIEVDVPEGVTLVHPELISIGKGCKIEPGAYVKGPCIIGENCEIRHGAYLRGDVIVGRGCVVGHASEVKHAIFLDGVHAAHFAYVGDSILGNDVNLGAGVKCANVRLDRQEVVVSDGKQRFPTGLRKLGAIVGDCCQIGCNSVLNPGTVLGQEVVCAPCLAMGGCVPAKRRVSSHVELVVESFEGVASALNRKR